MSKKILRVIGVIIAVQVVMAVVGQILARRFTRGDENSDEFQIAAICGGKQFRSHAHGLKAGTAIARMGGIDLDLRDATLDPAGADLELKATMGGFQVTVPPTWAVEVDTEAMAGGFEVKVTPREDLPADAPRLRIHASAVMGGGLVTTKAA